MIPRSEVLDEMERMVLSFDALARSWCFSGPFSWLELGWAGGIGTRCLSPFGFCRCTSLLLRTSKFHKLDIR